MKKNKRELQKENLYLRRRLDAISNLLTVLMNEPDRDSIMTARAIGRTMALAGNYEQFLDCIVEEDWPYDTFDSVYFDNDKISEVLKEGRPSKNGGNHGTDAE